jgi:predicted RNA-binding Zn ribbon-like protein
VNVAITIRKLISGFVRAQKSGTAARTAASHDGRALGLISSAEVEKSAI